MAKLKVRYLVIKPGRDGGQRHFFDPATRLRPLGWKTVRLADELARAVAQAQAIGAAIDAWREGRPAEVPPEHLEVALKAAPTGTIVGDQRATSHAAEAAPAPIRPGSLAALVAAYCRHEDFRELGERTRKSYGDNLKALEAWAGDAPVTSLTPRMFKTYWRDHRDRIPTKAKGVCGMAQILFGWARREAGYRGWIENGQLVQGNPAEKLNLKSARVERGEDQLWSDAEVAIFSAVAEDLGWPSIGVAVELNAWLGQREGDILALPAMRYRDGKLDVLQSKRGARVILPIDQVPDLVDLVAEQLERQRRGPWGNAVATTLLVCELTGGPWNENTFRRYFARVRRQAEKWCPSLAAKQFMLLRHTAIVRLAEAGCTAEEIHTISGHSLDTVNQILKRYLVRTRKMAENAFRKRLAAQESER